MFVVLSPSTVDRAGSDVKFVKRLDTREELERHLLSFHGDLARVEVYEGTRMQVKLELTMKEDTRPRGG